MKNGQRSSGALSSFPNLLPTHRHGAAMVAFLAQFRVARWAARPAEQESRNNDQQNIAASDETSRTRSVHSATSGSARRQPRTSRSASEQTFKDAIEHEDKRRKIGYDIELAQQEPTLRDIEADGQDRLIRGSSRRHRSRVPGTAFCWRQESLFAHWRRRCRL